MNEANYYFLQFSLIPIFFVFYIILFISFGLNDIGSFGFNEFTLFWFYFIFGSSIGSSIMVMQLFDIEEDNNLEKRNNNRSE